MIHGNLNSVRTLCDVRDVCESYWLACQKCEYGVPYNIGNETPVLFGDFLEILKSKAKVNDKKQEDYDLEKVIKILKEEGGRATQKVIRKEIPLSEAKISLMIAELEHKGVIEKIKKGRGNIIILKK